MSAAALDALPREVTPLEKAVAGLGKRLGWPQDKWTALRKESDSYRRALVYPWSELNTGEGFRCAKLLRYDDYVDQLAAHGGNERAAMKATVEAPSP